MSTIIYNDLARTSVANTFTAAQTMSGARFLQAAGANVASAGTLTLGNDGNTFSVTGTTTINNITGTGWTAGSVINLIFISALCQLTHQAGGAGEINIAGLQSYMSKASDVITLMFDGTEWSQVLPSQILTQGLTVRSGRNILAKGADVASAGDMTLGFDGNLFSITAATRVNAITTNGWSAGSIIVLSFASNPIISNNTAGGAGTAPILLAGGVDFNTTANDTLTLQYNGTSWVELARTAI